MREKKALNLFFRLAIKTTFGSFLMDLRLQRNHTIKHWYSHNFVKNGLKAFLLKSDTVGTIAAAY